MRIALIGDIHAYRLALWPWHLVSKRILGQANLWFRRRHQFRMHLWREVSQRIEQTQPDLLLLSGDLTTTALPAEMRLVRSMLEPLLAERRAVVVPGNHDEYTFTSRHVGRLRQALSPWVPPRFPAFEMLMPKWFLLSLNGAMPRLYSSRGRLGHAQLTAAAQYLATVGREEGVIVLCHYPLLLPQNHRQKWLHRLADGPALLQLLRGCQGRVLFLHGHIHEPWCFTGSSLAMPNLVAINAGAPCMVNARFPFGQGFWQIDLPPDPRRAIAAVHHHRDEQGQWQTSSSQAGD